MISKCANPACSTDFHYLRGGRLYRFDMRRPEHPCVDVPNAICAGRPRHASVYFWLCGECCRAHTVRFSPREGVSVVAAPFVQGRSAPVIPSVIGAD